MGSKLTLLAALIRPSRVRLLWRAFLLDEFAIPSIFRLRSFSSLRRLALNPVLLKCFFFELAPVDALQKSLG